MLMYTAKSAKEFLSMPLRLYFEDTAKAYIMLDSSANASTRRFATLCEEVFAKYEEQDYIITRRLKRELIGGECISSFIFESPRKATPVDYYLFLHDDKVSGEDPVFNMALTMIQYVAIDCIMLETGAGCISFIKKQFSDEYMELIKDVPPHAHPDGEASFRIGLVLIATFIALYRLCVQAQIEEEARWKIFEKVSQAVADSANYLILKRTLSYSFKE